MIAILKSVLAVAAVAISTLAAADVTFYEREGFQGRNFTLYKREGSQGRSFTSEKQVGSLERSGFSGRASSVVVIRDRWEVCENVQFGGRCVVLRPGRYASPAAMGLNERISSVRDVLPAR